MYCHVNVKTGSRGSGQSAAAKFDYISRGGKYEAACQDELVHLESGCMPSFAASDPRSYWAAADSHERSNGRLFRSLTAALPNSLDSAGRLELARSFAARVTAGELPYTLVVHAGLSVESKPDNPHLHLVFSERVNDGVERAAEQWFRRAAPAGRDPASGGARKSERTKPREWLDETRQAWAAEMNLAFDRTGVADRVTAESHATQLARAREAGDATEEKRLLLNPPSEHIGPAAKHRWEDRSAAPELKPDRYVEYEEASASAREARSAHARDAAEAAEARSRVETLDAEIAALETEQRRAEAAARRRKEAAARREAEERRDDAKWKERAKAREAALGLLPGGVELYLAHLADLDPKWNVNDNHATTRGNVDAALDAAESDARRLERLRGVLSDEAAAARYRQQLGNGAGRVRTADLDSALAPAEALRKRVSRLRELFATPGGDAAFLTALKDRNPSWSRTGTPIDIERALDVAGRRLDRRQAATLGHRVVLEAEQEFPDVPSAAWRRTGERFDEFTDIGRPGRRLTQTLSDRAGILAIAAEQPEPPASPGLVKRLFEWVRERVQKMLHRLRPSRARHRQERSPGGDVQPARAAAAEQARQERRQARKLITAARAAARNWGDIPLATGTLISVAESISARPGTSAAHRAVLEQIEEAAPRSALSTEAAGLKRRCRDNKDAAVDERHQQALREWSAESWTRRRMTGKPKREHPDPPNRHEVAAARDELVSVVRSAMITELEKLMPQPRPASPTRGRRPNAARRRCGAPRSAPAAFEAAPERWPGRATCRGAAPGSGPHPDTRPKPAPATSPPRRPPAPRDRGHEPGR